MSGEQVIDWSATYREPLCEYDNKGVKFFSPFCDPNYKPPQFNTLTPQRVWPDVDCKVPPLDFPSPLVKQFTDKESAHDWFKDPTYAQRIAVRRPGGDDNILDTNPSLQLYHKLKLMEKVAESLMQSL